MQMKYFLILILSIFVGFGVTTVYAHNEPEQICDNGQHIGNPHCITPTVTTWPSSIPSENISPTLVLPIPTDEEISDSPSPTAGDSATPTPQPIYPTPTEGSGGYFNDHLGCGEHSCIGKPASANNIPQSPPSTGRAE